MFTRTTLLFRAMREGAAGHARLRQENSRLRLQLTARGLPPGQAVLYAYRRGEAEEKLAQTQVKPNGEASLEAQGFRAPDALVLLGGEAPAPLLAGLCAGQGEEWLMEVRSAALALCRRLSPCPPPVAQVQTAQAAVSPPVADMPPAAKAETAQAADPPPVPREVFLPAIDPAPYTAAADRAAEPLLPPPAPAGPPADRLRPLRWPRGFESLKPYFERSIPRALFPMPGWRFAQAAQGVWIGIRREAGWVRGVAYACEGATPPAAQGRWNAAKGADGRWYQMMVQEWGQ